MKNIVSFETAKRLKEAGFPQPEFEFGQLWNTDDDRLCAFVGTIPFGKMKQDYVGNIIFLPTATDILEYLPKYALKIEKGVWCIFSPEYISATKSTDDEQMYFQHKNSAEAAAAAWLSINKKV